MTTEVYPGSAALKEVLEDQGWENNALRSLVKDLGGGAS